MSEYTIHEITTREEINELVDAAWKAWWDPYLPNIRIALPIFGYLAADRERGIAASKERMWTDFSNKPKNKSFIPYPNGIPQLNLYWWPEGEEIKSFCEEMMNQVYTPRSLWMQRPHGGMNNLMVRPDHRGRGVAAMLLQYQVDELDRREIEGFVEATEPGRPVYEKFGYQVVMKVDSYIPAGKSEDWQRWYHEMGISAWYAMWRPKFGKIQPGERTKPWQQGSQIPI